MCLSVLFFEHTTLKTPCLTHSKWLGRFALGFGIPETLNMNTDRVGDKRAPTTNTLSSRKPACRVWSSDLVWRKLVSSTLKHLSSQVSDYKLHLFDPVQMGAKKLWICDEGASQGFYWKSNLNFEVQGQSNELASCLVNWCCERACQPFRDERKTDSFGLHLSVWLSALHFCHTH